MTIDSIINSRFGKLVVVQRAEDYISPKGKHAPVYSCVCDCGNIVNLRKSLLISGKKLSCGCTSLAKQQINAIENVLPNDKLIDLYVNQNYSLRQLQSEYKIQRNIIRDKLISLGVELRDCHSIEYYETRRKYQEWQTGSRNYNKIMEQFLGRQLSDEEVVHHIDFNRCNNDITNLYLFKNPTMHLAYHGYLKKHEYIAPEEFVNKYSVLYETVLSYDYLYNEYIAKHKSITQISKENAPICRKTIKLKLDEYNLFSIRDVSINQYSN